MLIWFVVLYLMVSIGIGLFAATRVHTAKDFAVAGRHLPLIVDWPNRPLQKVDFEIGKPSLTRYRVLARDPANDTTRVELEPVTGRSHQLRVHMASLGHPILGDALYGGDATGRADRLLLHATDLGLFHPLTVAFMKFHAVTPF